MALTPRYWAFAALAACTLIAARGIPPRTNDNYRAVLTRRTISPERVEYVRVQDALRLSVTEWLSAVRSDSIAGVLRNAKAEPTSPTIIIDQSLLPITHSDAEQTIKEQWRALGIRTAAVQVVVEVLADTQRVMHGYDRGDRNPGEPHVSYVLPSSSVGGSGACIVMLRLGYLTRDLKPVSARYGGERPPNRANDQSLLGPCAYYAAFGPPGSRIGAWIAGRDLDLAQYVAWDRGPTPISDGVRAASVLATAAEQSDIMFTTIEGRACRLHDVVACERSILAAKPAGLAIRPGMLYLDEQGTWRRDWQGKEVRYLSDLRREMGAERFAQFWRSSEEPAAAFAAAMGMPLGEWTYRWAEEVFGPTIAGATLPAARFVEGLLVIFAALIAAAVFAQRRRVG